MSWITLLDPTEDQHFLQSSDLVKLRGEMVHLLNGLTFTSLVTSLFLCSTGAGHIKRTPIGAMDIKDKNTCCDCV